MIKFKTSVSAVAVALFLVACGGGGSGAPASAPVATTPPVSAPAPAPAVTAANIQTSVPALTYAATSEEHAFITAFNKFRGQMGLGLLAPNPLLDKAASNHLDYVLKNDVLLGGTVDMRSTDPTTGRSWFHIEQADKPLFTGVQELDRAKSLGYTGTYVGEQISFGGGKGGEVAFEGLASTVYHRAGLMFQAPNEVGIAVGQDRSQTFVIEVGTVKPQSQGSDFIGVYPASGQTGVGLHAGVETPNPFPELSTANEDFPTKTGYPISVVVKDGSSLEVLSFTVTEAGATTPLDSRVMTKASDPKRYLAANFAFLVAKAPFNTSTNYNVKFSGRINNVMTNKEWKFTTRQ